MEGCRDLERVMPLVDALQTFRKDRKLPVGLTGELAALGEDEDDEVPGLPA